MLAPWLVPRGQRRLQLLDLYLTVLLTGSDPTQLTGERLSADLFQAWNALRFGMPAELRFFMLYQAQEHLNRRGISDEPVRWEPPANWVNGVTWPGTDPDLLDPQRFRLLAARGASIGDVVEATHLSFENVRLYAEITSISFP